MIQCACGRQMLWTVDGKLACPGGHLQVNRPNVDQTGAPGTPFTGTLADFPEARAAELREKGCNG